MFKQILVPLDGSTRAEQALPNSSMPRTGHQWNGDVSTSGLSTTDRVYGIGWRDNAAGHA